MINKILNLFINYKEYCIKTNLFDLFYKTFEEQAVYNSRNE